MSVAFNTGQYPPVANLPAALNSSNLSVLATNSFADPNSGYPTTLRLAAAINDNSTGHFNLVSGLTLAGSAVSTGLSAIDKIQTTLTEIQRNVAVISSSANSDTNRKDNRVQLENNLKILSGYIDSANLAGFNLLDASNSDGVTLDLNSGQFANTGKTPVQNAAGVDQRFAYDPNRISFQITDLRAAFNDLNNLQVQTYPDTDANLASTNNLSTVSRFQGVLDTASTSLKSLRNTLASAAVERLTVNFDPNQDGNTDGSGARQMAARLALQLSNDSFNITSSPAARYFSLFT